MPFHVIVYLLFHVKVYIGEWSSCKVIAYGGVLVNSYPSSYVRYVHKAHFLNMIDS